MPEDCIFCRIAAGKAPASVVYENELVIAFMDISQANPGHVLVAPKRHVRDIYGLDEELAAEVMRVAVRVAKAVKRQIKPDGLNLLQANERAGLQSVFHFHLHVLPRFWGDEIDVRWPHHPAQPRARLDELAALIRAGLECAPP